MAKSTSDKVQPTKPGTAPKPDPANEPAETARTTRGYGNHNETTRITRRIALNHNETNRTTRGWTSNHSVTVVRIGG
ncbi:MAG: hypothetical protein QOJ92_1550 [Frankiales bacterium]|nr:hypothetical protein [Frankiales bacterium]